MTHEPAEVEPPDQPAVAEPDQFFELSLDLLAVISARTNVWLRVNAAFERSLGWTREELIGRSCFDIVHADDLIRSQEAALELAGGRQLRDFENRMLCKSGEHRWISWTTASSAEEELMFCVGRDVTAARAAQEAERQNEERLRLAIDIGQLATWDWRLEGGEISWSAAHFRMLGYEPNAIRPSFEAWAARVHPDDLAETTAAIAAAQETHTTYHHEFRALHPDGSVRICAAQGRFFYDAAGVPVRMIGVAQDVTEARRAAQDLRDSDARFRQFGRASSDVLSIRTAGTLAWEYLSPAFETIYGLAVDAAVSGDTVRNWLDLILPEDRETALSNLRRVQAGESLTCEFRVRRPSDNAVRWVRSTDFPMRDAEGRIERIGGISEDVTDEKGAVRQNALLLAELQHRVRNVLAMVTSITSRSAETSADLEEYRDHLMGRLASLARTQALLTRAAGAAVDLEGLVREELLAQVAGEAQISVSGPVVLLAPKTAEVLTLAVHELATNATKYGALASGAGRIDVSWSAVTRDARPWVRLEWRESGVRLASVAPRREGFGTLLVTQRVPFELGGRGTIDFRPGGVCSLIEFPLQEGESVLQTDAPFLYAPEARS